MKLRPPSKLAAVGVSTLLAVLFIVSCTQPPLREPKLDGWMPKKMLWAWERPEDMRFTHPEEYGVAFLAQTLLLEKERVSPKPRRQPLDVPRGAYMMAVTRIETAKGTFERPAFSTEMRTQVVELIKDTLELPDVRAVQIDFDATVSERNFYRAMMKDLRSELPLEIPLTMTALASWCTSDAWFNDFPVNEAVPMVFQMGADSENIKAFLRNGNDWREPLCRASYGISLEEGKFDGMKPGRRIYYFKNASWSAGDLRSL